MHHEAVSRSRTNNTVSIGHQTSGIAKRSSGFSTSETKTNLLRYSQCSFKYILFLSFISNLNKLIDL